MTCATLARPPFPGCLPRLDRPPCLEHLTVPGLLYHTFFLTLSYLHGTAVRTTRALPVVPGVPVVMIIVISTTYNCVPENVGLFAVSHGRSSHRRVSHSRVSQTCILR